MSSRSEANGPASSPAFAVALQEDTTLFTDALERNVVIVTASTLLATMRTVSFIWKQENQKRNVLEIARQSGLLYDKFVGFVDDLKQIGSRLESAHSAYDDAMNKLTVQISKISDESCVFSPKRRQNP